MKIINIKDKSSLTDFLNDINKNTLLRAHSNSCHHCLAMNPEWNKVIEKIEKNHKDDDINVVDLENEFLSETPENIKSEIMGFPMIFALKDGKILKKFEEPRTSDNIYNFCKKHLIKKKSSQEGGSKISKQSRKHKKSKKSKKSKKHKKSRKSRKSRKSKKNRKFKKTIKSKR